MSDIWNKYEPTAARKRGRPGRETRPKSLTLDMHAHVAVPRAGEIAAPHLKAGHWWPMLTASGRYSGSSCWKTVRRT